MDFENIHHEIKTFFETNLQSALDEVYSRKGSIPLPGPDIYVVDAVDTDRYSQKIAFYIQPADYLFQPLTTSSESMGNKVNILVTFRGDKSDNLVTRSLRYLEAIYALVKEKCTLGGIVDDSVITEAHVYTAVEGSPEMKAIELALLVKAEVN